MTFYALYNVTFEYLAFDISTTVTQETVSSQEFPAVTICNHNRYVVTLLSEFSYTGFASGDSFYFLTYIVYIV